MKKIAFWDNFLGERGTTVALYDYAYYNEKILKNKSFVFNNITNVTVDEVVTKFKRVLTVVDVKSFKEAEDFIETEKIDILYVIKSGERDDRVTKKCKTVIHCVFNCFQPHGNVYSSIAPWVEGNNGKYPHVPHMISLPHQEEDLRKKLGIPEKSIVFGRHGGPDGFNIDYVKKIICENFLNRDDIYFLFLNTNKFCESKNVIYLDKIINLEEKVKFINTCDAMLWARKGGETFGLSIGEFCTKNKPVLATKKVNQKCHISILDDKAIWYEKSTLKDIIENFDKEKVKEKDWNAYRQYTPENVMKKFKEVFIDEKKTIVWVGK